ncbi:LysE family translocator [Nocardioides sp. WL0053]|uniref:LysE family translocator n=1 Tax=Nocardioides jiangsuensis TaxID=2866161 RepID=A0ABS7RKX0_9ACTN|nr:LysE family translocator [Nocardioides jiangsuensis]MBY9074197.1 LysE family translocator [Nocardioides jiangsuensis]
MDLTTSLPAFVLAVVLISASPGPAMALILRRAALYGFRGAVPTVLGLELGLYLWALAAGAGFAALVAASEAAYLVLRVLGAGVLLYLGLRAWRGAWRIRRARTTGGPQAAERPSGPAGVPVAGGCGPVRAFTEGTVVQLANPKAAVFLMAFYPQFVPADQPLFTATAALALLQVTLETMLYLGLAAGVARAGAWFRRPRVRQRLEVVSGAVLVALGLRVASSGP